MDAASKLYAFYRYYFDVPAGQIRKDTIRFFGGWGTPETVHTVDWLFPLSWSEDGALVLTGSMGDYMGEPYLAVEEFDYLRRRFGLRDWPGEIGSGSD